MTIREKLKQMISHREAKQKILVSQTYPNYQQAANIDEQIEAIRSVYESLNSIGDMEIK